MKKLLTIVIALMTFTAVAQKAECHFTESKFIKASGKTIESEGNLKLTSADKLEMNYTKPAGDYSSSMARPSASTCGARSPWWTPRRMPR